MANGKDGSGMAGGSDVHDSFGRTFKYLMATQLMSILIPFIFNTWIVRHLAEADYALYAIKSHLLYIHIISKPGGLSPCIHQAGRSTSAGAQHQCMHFKSDHCPALKIFSLHIPAANHNLTYVPQQYSFTHLKFKKVCSAFLDSKI